MMKKIFLACAVFMAMLSCAPKKDSNNLKIDGTVEGVSEGTVYLQKFHNKSFFVLDSAPITNGEFHFSKEVELPEIYGLTLDTTRGSFLVFLDENRATVRLESSSYYRNTTIEGSELHDLYAEYKSLRNVPIDSFIRENPNSLVSAYALYRDFSYRLSPEEIKSNIRLLDPSLWNTPYVKVLEEVAATLEVVHIGKPAPDFSLNDPVGNIVQFSDQLSPGRYVLLDFWASWCGPCRRSSPSKVAAYERYHEKGLDIFSVSLDHNRDGWVEAIEKDHLAWTHVSDLQHWDSAPAKLYGIRAIPSNYLINDQGIIVAKNLRGEELEKTLGDLLP